MKNTNLSKKAPANLVDYLFVELNLIRMEKQ